MEQVYTAVQPQLRRYLMQKAAVNRKPISGTFELTPRCNMNCKMCYIRMSEAEMSARGREYTAQEWIDMGQTCAQQGMLFLLLTGGEPFLRKDFREIYTEMKKLGLLVSINTNATLLDEQTIQWLAQDAPSKVSVTLYGSSNDTYKQLCGHPTGYDAAVRAIDCMKEAGILVNINASFTRSNVGDMEAIAEFGKSRGIPVNAATYMFPPVRSAREGSAPDPVRLSPEESGYARAKAEILTMEPQVLAYRLELLHSGCVGVDLTDEDCTRTADEKMGCMAGKGSFWITWDGRMTPCGMMNEPVALPFETGFVRAWEQLAGQTEQLLLPAACRECALRSACMVCGALCMAESNGSTQQKPEYLCRQTKAYLAYMEQEYQRRIGVEV